MTDTEFSKDDDMFEDRELDQIIAEIRELIDDYWAAPEPKGEEEQAA